MAMYYYARKLQKGASSSSSSSSSGLARQGGSKTPPTVNINGSIPCCSSKSVQSHSHHPRPHPHHHQHHPHSMSNGPIGLPPPPPCVMMGVNGGLVSGGSYQRFPNPHHQHNPPQQQHQYQHQPSQHAHVQHQRYHIFNGPCCCGGLGGGGGGTTASSLANTPSQSRRLPLSAEEADRFYDDDFDNESDIPVLCKVHLHNQQHYPHQQRGNPGQGQSSGHQCSVSPRSCEDEDDDELNFSPLPKPPPPPPEHESKDLIFNGPHLISGTWEALVHHLLPTEAHFPDEDYIFAFLLSARLYIGPHELLGRIFQQVIDVSLVSSSSPDEELAGRTNQKLSLSVSSSPSRKMSPPKSTAQATSSCSSVLGQTFTSATGLSAEQTEIAEDDLDLPLSVIPLLVQFLRPWTEIFPYDFRDDRMMAHVRNLAHKCVASHEEVREEVSQLLAALLARLAGLERYEEFLHRITTEASIGEPIAAPSVVTICPDPATMAEQLTLVELQRFSFIGPDEFVQTLGKEDLKTGVRVCDCVNRKTKNLEAYVRWFQRLTYYVASEICKMSKKKSRCRVCEYWIQVAKECLNIRNFNSLMAILAGLNILPVARLKKTWSKPLCTELAEVEKAVDPQQNYAPYRKLYKAAVWQCRSGAGENKTYRIIVPYFSLLMKDLYNLDSVHPSRLPNGHIDFEKCRQLAKLVSEINFWQKVQCDFVQIQSIFNSVQASPIFNEQELIYASYLCEQPETPREKEQFKKLHRQNFQVPLIACNSSSENDT